jgi:hypothetical protein
LALVISPGAALQAIVDWITNFIKYFLNPHIKPYYKYIKKLEQLLVKITELEAAIANAAGRITSCSITTPTIVTVTIDAPPNPTPPVVPAP